MVRDYSAETIQVLKGLEAVRRRPEMYLGDLNDPNLTTQLLLQALCHAVDEVLNETCLQISVMIDGARATVSYDVGMSLDPDERHGKLPVAMIFLSVHRACSNQKKHISVGSDYCAMGLAVLNAVSYRLSARIHHSRRTTVLRFRQGELVDPIVVSNSSAPDSTEIQFELDSEILPGTRFDPVQIRNQLMALKTNLAFAALEITFQDDRI